MDNFELHKVHHYQPVAGQGSAVQLVATRPYIRMALGNSPPLYVKGGQVMGESGDVVTEIPRWFWEQARSLSPAARAEVGLRLPEEVEAAVPVPVLAKKAPTKPPVNPVLDGPLLWTCPEPGCGEQMPVLSKGLHIGRHRKAAKRAVATAGRV